MQPLLQLWLQPCAQSTKQSLVPVTPAPASCAAIGPASQTHSGSDQTSLGTSPRRFFLPADAVSTVQVVATSLPQSSAQPSVQSLERSGESMPAGQTTVIPEHALAHSSPGQQNSATGQVHDDGRRTMQPVSQSLASPSLHPFGHSSAQSSAQSLLQRLGRCGESMTAGQTMVLLVHAQVHSSPGPQRPAHANA